VNFTLFTPMIAAWRPKPAVTYPWQQVQAAPWPLQRGSGHYDVSEFNGALRSKDRVVEVFWYLHEV